MRGANADGEWGRVGAMDVIDGPCRGRHRIKLRHIATSRRTVGRLLLLLSFMMSPALAERQDKPTIAYLSEHPLCEPGTQWDGNACASLPACPIGNRWSGTDCVAIQCTAGFRLEGSNCEPITCPVGQRLNNNACEQIVCGSGESLTGNICTPSTRFVALAVGQTNHLGYGAAWDKTTMDEAQNEALRLCRSRISDGNCKIILSGDQCLALFWTPTGTGWGAARRITRDAAKDAAAASCTNANKRRKCVLAGAWCNSG
jgi:hypothetical protein